MSSPPRKLSPHESRMLVGILSIIAVGGVVLLIRAAVRDPMVIVVFASIPAVAIAAYLTGWVVIRLVRVLADRHTTETGRER